jgi:hypothetical protein
MPATCEVCQQQMVEGGGFVALMITIGGQLYERLRHESEAERACFMEAGVNKPLMPVTGGFPCHDCGTAIGALHHPGCDMERCP